MRMTKKMTKKIMTGLVLSTAAGLVVAGSEEASAQPPPTIEFRDLLNTYFDDETGLISFQGARMIFAPEGELNAQIAVIDTDNKILGSFRFSKDYRSREGVYARARVETPADITLTEPGIYTIVYVVDNVPVSRLPVRLELSSAGDDPFNPTKKYRYDGYWRTFAYLTMGSYRDAKVPVLNYWLGGKDLAPNTNRGRPFVTLLRDGEVVAHSRRNTGTIMSGHFKPVETMLYEPHDERGEANAIPFSLENWQVDGTYEVRVTRQSDNKLIRSFDFRSSGGKIEPHPRSQMGFQPQTDYIAPRVQRKGATSLELAEAIWIEDRKL